MEKPKIGTPEMPAGAVVRVVGYHHGEFVSEETGALIPYAALFVTRPFEGTESATYHFAGETAVKLRCVSKDVFNNVQIGQRAQLFFNERGKVNYMIPIAEDGV